MAKWKLMPETLKLPTVTIMNEENTAKVQGVLIKPSVGDSPDLFRRVTLFSEKRWAETEHIMTPQSQIRASQASECFEHLVNSAADARSEAH